MKAAGIDLKKIFNFKNLMRFIFATFIGSIIFILVKIVLAPTIAPSSETTVRVKSDYVLMLIQCVLGLIAMMLPKLLHRFVRLKIPSVMIIMYAVFLYCAIYLGEVRDFYFKVPHWDTILHLFSGIALGALGFSLVSLLNDSKSTDFFLSPFFVSFFAFCFALSLGTLWEIYEFLIDSILKTNSQKYALETGELLIGQAALADTMKDLIVDAVGALAMSIVGFFSLKHDKKWLDGIKLKTVNKP